MADYTRKCVIAENLTPTYGWWHLNTQDAWDLLGELHTNPSSEPWQQALLLSAKVNGLTSVIGMLTISGMRVKKISDDHTYVVVGGAIG